MTPKKHTVKRYMEAFHRLDHKAVLSTLTDDVEWVCPGVFHHKGKAAFDKEIENDAFEGAPKILVTRLIEEGDLVVAEGTVQTKKKGGEVIDLVFCDVFEMRGSLIRKLISYLMPAKSA